VSCWWIAHPARSERTGAVVERLRGRPEASRFPFLDLSEVRVQERLRDRRVGSIGEVRAGAPDAQMPAGSLVASRGHAPRATLGRTVLRGEGAR
jgi:hypothetical protein